MRALDQKLLREFRSHLGMLLAVTSIIAVGVANLVMMTTAYLNLSEAKRLYYAECRMADFSIELKKAPLAELRRLAAMPEVAEIRPRIQQYATVDIDGVAEPLNAQVLSLPDRRRSIINDVVIRQGGYFTDRRDNEVIVNEEFARSHRLHPGQWIRLVLNNRRQELFIVGTAISSEFVYLLNSGAIVPDSKRFGVFYLKQSYMEDVFDFRGSANQVLGRLSVAAHGNPRETLRRAEQTLSDFGVFTTTPLEDQPSNKFLTQEIQGLRSFGFITPCMFLAAAALVLNVLLSRLAQQQRTVIGTLKALGYSNAQLFWHFLKFGLAVGAGGGVLGCALGWWLAMGMTAIYRRFYTFPDLSNHFYWDVHASALLVSVGCAVLGSLHGSRAVLRLRPAQAMRPNPPRHGGPVFLERFGQLWNSLSSAWRMVVRNVLRSRVRTGACIFAAAMGGSLMVNGFMMEASLDHLVDFQFRWIARSDVDLTFKDECGRDALSEAARLPGVDRAEPILNVACTFIQGPYRKKGAVTGLSRNAVLTSPRDTSGRKLRVPSHGLLLSRTLADMLHVERGDTIVFQPITGQRRRIEAPVAGVADSYLGVSVYADIEYLSRLIDEEYALTGVQLATDRNPSHRASLYRELKQMPALQAVNERVNVIRNLEEAVLDNQRIVIVLLVFFAGIVFFGSILNASLVSLAERRREVATLRVLGYGPWEVGSLLLRESMITTVLGALLGMPLGYLLTKFAAVAYASEMFRMPIVASPGLWITTLAFAVFFGLITHVFVQRAIHGMDWLDALKTQE